MPGFCFAKRGSLFLMKSLFEYVSWLFWAACVGIGREDSLHASAAAGPVAVVEVEAFTLEDEGANAIL